MKRSSWDYIVVGAGSAGCVLAARLSEDPAVEVLLVEAGGSDRSPVIHVPGLVPQAIGSRALNWSYEGEPDPTLSGRRLTWAAGRALGGSSSINGMVFVRGLPSGFDGWAADGAPGWGWNDLLPYFRKLETWAGETSPLRGTTGPVHVRRFTQTDRACAAWMDAAVTGGLVPAVADHNAGIDHGVGLNQGNQIDGRRCSTAVAYLGPASRRPNLTVATRTRALRLTVDAGRCTGLEVLHEGRVERWSSSSEVLVASGAIASPRLLMLSGIGPADALRAHGIAVTQDVPGVGRHLNEHVNIKLSVRTRTRTYSSERRGWRKAVNGLRWLATRDGPASSPVGHVMAFMKTDPALPAADIQVQVMPMGFDLAFGADFDSISSVVSLTQPRVRGSVELRSADAHAPPRIRIALLEDDDDVARLARGCELVRDIHARAAAGNGPLMEEVFPGPKTGHGVDAWREAIRRDGSLNWHPTSTCRMGLGANDVVDLELRVHGVAGLRVVDASVMRSVPAGNTNAPVIALAEKAADLIRGRTMVADG